jgi:hypothetical protein
VLVARAAAAVREVQVAQARAHPVEHRERVDARGRGVREVERVVAVPTSVGSKPGSYGTVRTPAPDHREHVLDGAARPRRPPPARATSSANCAA